MKLHWPGHRPTITRTQTTQQASPSRLQQAASTSNPQLPANSLIAQGQNMPRPAVIQQRQQNEQPEPAARQRGRSFSLRRLLGLGSGRQRNATIAPEPESSQPPLTQPDHPPRDAEQIQSQLTNYARIRQNIIGQSSRPTTEAADDNHSATNLSSFSHSEIEELGSDDEHDQAGIKQQLDNFAKIRQNILQKLPSSSDIDKNALSEPHSPSSSSSWSDSSSDEEEDDLIFAKPQLGWQPSLDTIHENGSDDELEPEDTPPVQHNKNQPHYRSRTAPPPSETPVKRPTLRELMDQEQRESESVEHRPAPSPRADLSGTAQPKVATPAASSHKNTWRPALETLIEDTESDSETERSAEEPSSLPASPLPAMTLRERLDAEHAISSSDGNLQHMDSFERLPEQHIKQIQANYSQVRTRILGKLLIDKGDDPQKIRLLEQHRPPPLQPAMLDRQTMDIAAEIEESPIAQQNPKAITLDSKFPIQPLDLKIIKGKLVIGESLPAPLQALLKKTVAAEGRTYAAIQSNSDNTRHILLDGKGRIFDIHSRENSYNMLHSSKADNAIALLAASAIKGKTTLELVVDEQKNSISVIENHPKGNVLHKLDLPIPDNAYHALVTGVWRTKPSAGFPQGEDVRLHKESLFVLSPDLEVWQKSKIGQLSQLSRQADGNIWAVKDKRTLVNLNTGKAGETFADKIKSFAVDSNGRLLVLTDTAQRHQMCLMRRLDAAPEQRQMFRLRFSHPEQALKHGFEFPDAKAIGIANNKLYIADSEGKLYVGYLPSLKEQEVAIHPVKQIALEGQYQIQKFSTDDNGRLMAMVKDNFRQQHLCPLGAGDHFRPGWNITDALVLDNQMGLEQIQPDRKDILDLERFGKLTLQEGSLHYFDMMTRAWTDAEQECSKLKRGLDNQLYIMHDNEIKPLTINQSTSSMKQGRDNIFALPHIRNKPEVGNALHGTNKENTISTMAIVDKNNYFTCNDAGEIRYQQVHPGVREFTRPPRKISLEGIEGKVQELHLDGDKNLYARTKEGRHFLLPFQEWNNTKGITQPWRQLVVPGEEDAEIKDINFNKPFQPELSLSNNHTYQLKKGKWQPITEEDLSSPSEKTRRAGSLFEQLKVASGARRIPGTGITVQAKTRFLGLTGGENAQIRSPLAARLRAHFFNTTLSTPRPIKNIGYSVQHRWQGRRGLKPLYEMQSTLYRQLLVENKRNNEVSQPLEQHLMELKNHPQAGALANEILRFAKILSDNATQAALRLGQQQGIVNNSGSINKDFKNTLGKASIQSININRSGDNLSQALLQRIQTSPPTENSRLPELLSEFVRMGLDMSHSKADIPLGRQRDPSDMTSITKSRLILDVLTLGELHNLAEQLKEPLTEQQIERLTNKLDNLRDSRYLANPVKQFSDMGFTNTVGLEASYDAIKGFLNAFKKQHHGVNVATRSALQAKNSSEVAEKLHDILKSLDEGELLSVTNSYSAGISTAYVVPLPKKAPLPVVPGGGLNISHTYNMAFIREGGLIGVIFSRDNKTAGTLSVASGYDVMKDIAHKNKSIESPFHLFKRLFDFIPDLRIGGGIAASLQQSQLNDLYFTLQEHEIAPFLKGLTEGGLEPADLMKKGIQHATTTGKRVTFSLDISGAFELRAGVKTDSSSVDNYSSRSGIGISGSANILTKSSENSITRTEKSHIRNLSTNRIRLFNEAAIGAGIGFSAGVVHSFTAKDPNQPRGALPAFNSVGISGAININDNTNQIIRMELKVAEPVEEQEIIALMEQLEKHFQDTNSTQVLKGVKELEDNVEKLSILHSHFSAQAIRNDDRYESLRNLKDLWIRDQVARQEGGLLGSACYETTYTNLARLNKEGLFALIGRHMKITASEVNARHINGLMKNNPLLSKIIKALQEQPLTTAMVSLELNDKEKYKLEMKLKEGLVAEEDEIIALFKDRSKLRIRSIEFNRSVDKTEGFTIPALLFGVTSSASIGMYRKIGSINFKYGHDQDIPRRFTLEGEIASASPEIAAGLRELKKEGMELRT